MSKIIFKNEDNTVGIITPTDEALQYATIKQIAVKDVPSGLSYKIVDDEDIPTDRTFRDAWEWDDTVEADGVGGDSDEFDDTVLEAILAAEEEEETSEDTTEEDSEEVEEDTTDDNN